MRYELKTFKETAAVFDSNDRPVYRALPTLLDHRGEKGGAALARILNEHSDMTDELTSLLFEIDQSGLPEIIAEISPTLKTRLESSKTVLKKVLTPME